MICYQLSLVVAQSGRHFRCHCVRVTDTYGRRSSSHCCSFCVFVDRLQSTILRDQIFIPPCIVSLYNRTTVDLKSKILKRSRLAFLDLTFKARTLILVDFNLTHWLHFLLLLLRWFCVVSYCKAEERFVVQYVVILCALILLAEDKQDSCRNRTGGGGLNECICI